jgi:hypothetical protein
MRTLRSFRTKDPHPEQCDALFERGVVEQAFSFKTPFEHAVLPAPGTQSVLEGQKQMTSTTHENI